MKITALPLLILSCVLAFTANVLAGPADFSGIWDTRWDSGKQTTQLTITQSGNEVTGKYTYQGGKVEGTIKGDTLSGTWVQKDGAKGTFIFTLSENGKSFKGKWRNGSSGAWAGEWDGTRADGAH